MWTKTKTIEDVKKETDIVALNSKIDHLEALLAKGSNENSTTQKGFTSNNKSREHSSWKITAPKQGEPWSKVVNGKTFNWCKFHNFWSTQHNTKNCRKGLKIQGGTNSNQNPQLEINLAATDYDLPDSMRVLFTPVLRYMDKNILIF